jgi:uncharacterized protein (TIGR03000 family)
MRLLTVLVLLCAGTAHADDPATKARASWAWATAKAEPAKTAWAVTDTKAVRYVEQAEKPADVVGHTWVVEEFDVMQPSGVPLLSYRWALYATGSPGHKAWEIRDAKSRARDFTKLDAGNRDPSIKNCWGCSGKGVITLRSGEEAVCPHCNGDGYKVVKNTAADKTPCPLCNGVAGKVCRDCGGAGYVTDMPKQEAKPARLEVTLPADATLWIDGQATRAVGTLRTFVSPPIDRESVYHLMVQIVGEYAQTEDVKVWPGKTSKISFASIDRIPAQQFRGYWAPAAPMLNGGAECVGGT